MRQHQFDDLHLYSTKHLGQTLEGFARWMQVEKNFSPYTLRNYLCDCKQLLIFLKDYWGTVPHLPAFLNLSTTDIRAFLSHLRNQGLSKRSLARRLSTIRTFFKYLALQDHIIPRAATEIKGPRLEKTLPRALKKEEIKSLLSVPVKDWTTLRDRALFTLLYGAGLRIGEALALRQESVQALQPFLKVEGKGQKERLVPILPQIYEAIAVYLRACPFSKNPKNPLFLGVKGGWLNASVAQRSMAKLRLSLNLISRATPHGLRHSCASHLLDNGGDLRHIQELLGHASLRSTQIYTQVSSQKLLRVYQSAHPQARARALLKKG